MLGEVYIESVVAVVCHLQRLERNYQVIVRSCSQEMRTRMMEMCWRWMSDGKVLDFLIVCLLSAAGLV
jgi:hypothetical protein